MRFQINIGLEIPDTKSNVQIRKQRAKYALSLLQQKFAFVEARIEQSATEQTLVASFQTAASRAYGEALAISEALQQDCVALYCADTRTGALLGHKAAQWGAFNPAYFIKY